MQFIVTAWDYKDSDALRRRMDVREEHLSLVVKMKEEGHDLFAAAMINDKGDLIGSTMIMDFDSKEELDRWLEKEPYVTNKVWEDINVQECRIPDLFLKS